MLQNIKKIGWKTNGLSADLASVRYRAILPILALEQAGIDYKILFSALTAKLDEIDALIIVKSFTAEDLYLAQKANSLKIPVFFDLCDNVFIESYRGKQVVTPAEMLKAIIPFLSGIIVTTSPLKTVVENIAESTPPVFVVPDGIETKRDFMRAKKILAAVSKQEIKFTFNQVLLTTKENSKSNLKVSYQRAVLFKHHIKSNLKSYLKPITWVKRTYAIYDLIRSKSTGVPRKSRRPIGILSDDIYLAGNKISKKIIPVNAKRVIWFGNHGAKHAQFGMLDLLPIRKNLENINKEIPLELIVISNNREKFIKYIGRFECVTRYIEWSADAVEECLKVADAVLIPNSKDAFSICKSANRTVLSLNANVPVIADLTPALHDLGDAIYIDNFYDGLKKCLSDAKDVRARVSLGKKIIDEKYGKQAIAKAYSAVFNDAILSVRPKLTGPCVVMALHLIQDYELASPIILRMKEIKVNYVIWLSFSLARKSPRTLQFLTDENIPYYCFPDDIAITDKNLFNDTNIQSLITIAETNLGPHKFTHYLTQQANVAKVKTVTLQHGFENVGLTYSDSVHDIKNIEMASKYILTWGDESTLHENVKPDIKQRIKSVGCPKPVALSVLQKTPLDSIDKKIIGIFENLHWHRYSQKYQEDFLCALVESATKYPEIIFFIKPHPAGMWLTSRFKGTIPEASNIIIADPISSDWERFSINDFLVKLSGVISTPSTVALDAARMNIPTLVCGFDLELDNYLPLSIARNKLDWFNFIESLATENTTFLLSSNTDFVKRTIVDGNAVNNIIEVLTTN